MRRGFSLVELMVAIGLMLIIMSVVLANYPEFNRRTELNGIAHKLALSIREAQQNSVSGKEFRPNMDCYPGFGVRIGPIPASATSYTLFGDLPSPCPNPPPAPQTGNGWYDGVASEQVQTFTMKAGYSITAMCIDTSPCAPVNQLTILFPKRSTGAVITSNLPSLPGTHSSARITVSRGSISKNIFVGISGHAYVQ